MEPHNSYTKHIVSKQRYIVWLSNILALSVPDECYSRTAHVHYAHYI